MLDGFLAAAEVCESRAEIALGIGVGGRETEGEFELLARHFVFAARG
jgi:hypothetical protein